MRTYRCGSRSDTYIIRKMYLNMYINLYIYIYIAKRRSSRMSSELSTKRYMTFMTAIAVRGVQKRTHTCKKSQTHHQNNNGRHEGINM